MDFLIHWLPGPVVATVQCQGLTSAGSWELITVDMLGVVAARPGCNTILDIIRTWFHCIVTEKWMNVKYTLK